MKSVDTEVELAETISRLKAISYLLERCGEDEPKTRNALIGLGELISDQWERLDRLRVALEHQDLGRHQSPVVQET